MPNESAKIILAATHSKLTKVRDPLIVEGTVNALKVEFQFRTTDWDSTIKTAVFVRGRATPSTSNADLIHVTLDENNECDVPSEILVPNGHFSVGVFGVGTDHTIPSNWMYYHTADGCYTSGGNTPIDTTPSLYEQILKILQNKSDIGHDHNQTYYTKLESDERYARRGESIGSIVAGVTSINNKTGDVILNAEDVGAFANITRQTETEIYNDVIRNGDIQHDSIGLIEGHQYKLEIHYNPSGTPRVDTIMVTARYSELLQCVAVPNRNDDDYVASGMTDPGNDGFAIGDTVTHVHANWFNQFVPVSVKLYAVNYIQVPTIPYDAIIDPPITQVQPDWNQTDSTAIDYIKNRTHWKEEKTNDIVLVDNITLDNFEDTESGFYRQTTDCYVDFERTMGQTYFVIWDGVEYECVCGGIVEDFGIGNANIMGDYGSKTAEPFAIHHSSFEDPISVSIKDNGSHTLSVLQRSTATEIHYLDSKYIKDMYYDNTIEEVIVDNLTSDEYHSGNYPPCNFVVGDAYSVIWNGVLYENVVCTLMDEWRVLGGMEDYPFSIDDDGGDSLYIEDNEEPYAVSIIHIISNPHKVLRKYLPNSLADWNENNENASNYIQNRPFYDATIYRWVSDGELNELLKDTTTTQNSVHKFRVIIDGVVYEDVPGTYGYMTGAYIGLGDKPSSTGWQTTDFGFYYARPANSPAAGWNLFTNTDILPDVDPSNVFVEVFFQDGDLKTIDEKFIPDTIARTSDIQEQVQSDWNQRDDTKADYIKNRPMYFDIESLAENLTASGNTGAYTAIVPEFILDDGAPYYVKGAHTNDKGVVTAFDGVYECKNGVIDILTWEYSGCPILNISANGINVGISNSTRVASVVIDVIGVATYHTLDERYIPDTIIRVKDVSNIIEDKIKEIGVNITAAPARIGSVELLADKWVGTSSPYSQVVTVDGATENSQVDLTPSVEQLAIFHHKDLAFVTENEDGIVTVYAIGQKPENDYVIQVTITEVII
jgi:hypothetical protein